uniref:Putative secreted protein n=1 Tax=Ixodes ricinus TaxID=34613 RepID=A0A6B0U6B6_IXORI
MELVIVLLLSRSSPFSLISTSTTVSATCWDSADFEDQRHGSCAALVPFLSYLRRAICDGTRDYSNGSRFVYIYIYTNIAAGSSVQYYSLFDFRAY